MQKVLKAKEMAYADEKTITNTGIHSLVLMENAGRTASEIIINRYSQKEEFLIVAGSGNNGGDGLVIARYLHKAGKKVEVLILAESKEKLSKDNLKNLEIFQKINGKVSFVTKQNLRKLTNAVKKTQIVIDAIFGTGFTPPVKGYREKAIQIINKYSKPIISIDIPSGLSADTGTIYPTFIKANLTITFAFPKLCHILYPASQYCGDIYIVDISIDEKYLKNIHRYIIQPSKVKLPLRKKDSHKYANGHTLVIGGSTGKTGAVIMASKASNVSGAGLVTAVVPKSLNPICEQTLIEEMTIPIDDQNGIFGKNSPKEIKQIIKQGKYTSIVVGMGMSVNPYTKNLIKEILTISKPVVIDADGLNNLANLENFEKLLIDRKESTVLTPHIGEMSRLTGYETSYILENMEEVAKQFALKTRTYVVLKSARTVIATPNEEVYYSITGNEGMATAGTGDILAGIIGTMVSRLNPKDAVITGVTLHGIAGDLAVEEVGKESLKATDLLLFIPKAYKTLENLKESKEIFSFYQKLI
ncbi:MAG: NAD(P)H-hydrate dehydratase [Aquificae bacterium]|nr:NAD(P)H-hydrate dehydratase [Aquificota bacterium]